MSTHSRLALMGAALTLALAIPVCAGIWYYSGWAQAASFVYGVGVGVAGFVSIALTVSLLTVRPTGVRVILGFASYAGRLVLVVAAVGVPAYLKAWPVVPMLCGLAGIYAVENVLILTMAPKSVRAGNPGRPVGEGVERRTGV